MSHLEALQELVKTRGVPIHPGPPPGPPPREGLEWDPESHRWLAAREDKTPMVYGVKHDDSILYPGRATRPCILYTHGASKRIVEHAQKTIANLPPAARGNIQEIALNQRLGKSPKTGMAVAGRFMESNHRIFIAKQPDNMVMIGFLGSFICHEAAHALLTDVVDILRDAQDDSELYSAYVKFEKAAKKYGPVSEYAGKFKGLGYVHENFADMAGGEWSTYPEDRDWMVKVHPEMHKVFNDLVDAYSRGIGK